MFIASAPQAPLGPLEREAVLLTRANSRGWEGNAAPLAWWREATLCQERTSLGGKSQKGLQ